MSRKYIQCPIFELGNYIETYPFEPSSTNCKNASQFQDKTDSADVTPSSPSDCKTGTVIVVLNHKSSGNSPSAASSYHT